MKPEGDGGVPRWIAERRAQGLPDRIEDPDLIERIARIVRGGAQTRETPGDQSRRFSDFDHDHELRPAGRPNRKDERHGT